MKTTITCISIEPHYTVHGPGEKRETNIYIFFLRGRHKCGMHQTNPYHGRRISRASVKRARRALKAFSKRTKAVP